MQALNKKPRLIASVRGIMTRISGFLIWNKVGDCIDEGFHMRVVWTKAHATLEEKARITLELAQIGAVQYGA